MKGGGVTQPFGLKDIPPKTGNLGPKTLILALFGFFEFIGLFGLLGLLGLFELLATFC